MIDLNPQPKSAQVVPFGKYKGQPVEVLAQDKSYLDWLSAQDWFKERYKGIYTLIVNNFAEASETPEHNALQVLFLDDEFCFAFIEVAAAQWIKKIKTEPLVEVKKRTTSYLNETIHQLDEAAKEWVANYAGKMRPEKKNAYDYAFETYERRTQRLATLNEQKAKMEEELALLPEILTYSVKLTKEFESRGVDVLINAKFKSIEKLMWSRGYGPDPHEDSREFKIEIKPAVGDDYPAILRQMKASGSKYLFTQRYAGLGATKEQFVQTLKLSGVTVVFQEDIKI